MERKGITTHFSVAISIAAMVAIASLATAQQQPSKNDGNIAGISTGGPRPCCNNCGPVCTATDPPLCTCNDVLLACHPSCKKCVRAKIAIYPPRYQCLDRIAYDCKKKCEQEYPEGGEVAAMNKIQSV